MIVSPNFPIPNTGMLIAIDTLFFFFFFFFLGGGHVTIQRIQIHHA